MREVRIGNCRLFCGDNRGIMPIIPEGIVHSIVTDPPYGLSFMGKGWDHGVPGREFWELALRCCRPGAHLLAFGGTRTYHRLACAVEDAEWEIRDCLGWLYGSGFPKSLDVSKAIDAAVGAEREVIGSKSAGMGSGGTFGMLQSEGRNRDAAREIPVTAPATEAAKQWDGWGTALKPAWEPIILARKPIVGTVAENVQRYSTGAINIDGCRVKPTGESRQRVDEASQNNRYTENGITSFSALPGIRGGDPSGRFPANIIHDGSDDVLAIFPEAGGGFGVRGGQRNLEFGFKGTYEAVGFGDSGSASRFFYCAKPSAEERCEYNAHPTVKPVELMKYLIKLATVKNGIVCDLFMGSGTTGIAAIQTGCRFIGIEQDEKYFEIAVRRITDAHNRQVIGGGFDL